eukprot:m.234538 g.234538  ORF g.234538 m.234538 type:complete len:189 (+) comp12673_c0_seq1:44-610(+)
MDVFEPVEHPTAVFFHLFFRSAALFTYLFCTWFSSNFVLNFIVIIMLVSFDFWTVKNVSGRLLVGLRWWNKVNDDGTSEWMFESKKSAPHPREAKIFWWSLYLFPLAWCLLAIPAFLKLSAYVLVVAVALSLNAANLIGYSKCDKDARAKLTNMAGQFGQSLLTQALSSVASAALSSATGAKPTAPAP